MIKLISSCFDGFVRIWDFNSSSLLQKIDLKSGKLYGICLWDKNNLLIGCEDNSIKLLNTLFLFIILKKSYKTFKSKSERIIERNKALML